MSQAISSFESLPPWAWRQMAIEPSPTRGVRRTTLRVMLKRGKIKKRTFQRIAASENFDDVKYGNIKKFFLALAIDPNDHQRIAEFFAKYGDRMLKLKPSSWADCRNVKRKANAYRKLKKWDERFRRKMEGKV